MALLTIRAQAHGGTSPSTWSRGLRIFMTGRVGRTGSDEQGRGYRVRPDSAGAGFISRISRAPARTALQRSAPPRHANKCVRHPSLCGHDRTDGSTAQISGNRPFGPDGKRLEARGVCHCGKFNCRSIAWKRVSLRSESMSASVFTYTTPPSGSRTALSSHSSALAVLPHFA
jgi:hypothetical protein